MYNMKDINVYGSRKWKMEGYVESFYETLGNYIRIDQECIIYGSLEK